MAQHEDINKMKKNDVNLVVDNNDVVEPMFVIEKNVPIPEKTTRVGKKGAFRSTIESMEIGDSFVVKDVPKNYYNIQKLTGVKLIKNQNNDGTVRIWRKA